MIVPSREEFLTGCEEFEKHDKRDAMYKVATFLVSYFWDKPPAIPTIADGLGVLLLTWNQAFYRYGIFEFDKLEECISNNRQMIESFKSRNLSSLSNGDDGSIKNLFRQFLYALQIDSMRFSNENKKKYTKKHLEDLLDKWKIRYGATSLEAIYESIKGNAKIKDAIEFVMGTKKEYIQLTISKLADAERESLESTKLIMKSPVAVAKALHLLAPNFFPLWDGKIARAYRCYYNDRPAEKYVSFCKITKTMVEKLRNCVSRQDKTAVKMIDEYNYSKYTQKWI